MNNNRNEKRVKRKRRENSPKPKGEKARKSKTSKIVKYKKAFHINPVVVVFLVIFAYIVIMTISYFKSDHITPYEVKIGSLAVNNTYDGVILRDETVINCDFSGYINYYAREGEKVPAYSMVYTVDSTGKLADMISEESNDDSSMSNESLTEVRNRISDFAVDFNPSNFDETYTFKYSVEGTVLKMANSTVLANIDKLRAENYSDSIDFGYSPDSGVVIYSTDGYEDLTAETILPEQVSAEEYEKKQFKSNDLIAQGDAAYKLITSELWTILIEIEEERAENLEQENYIEVRFLKNNYTSWAAVSVLRQNGKTYAKLDFNNSMITFATDRFVEIELLGSAQEGLKIPKSAIVERKFYLIPSDYIIVSGASGETGFTKEVFLEDGTCSTEFVAAEIYNEADGMYYIDENVLQSADRLVKPESDDIFYINAEDPTAKASLTGVYNINKGYADFKQITILNENDEYAIVKSNSEYGLCVYDHIVLKGDTVKDNDFIYELTKE